MSATVDVTNYFRMSLAERDRFDAFMAASLDATVEEFKNMLVFRVDALMDDGIVLQVRHRLRGDDGRMVIDPRTNDLMEGPPLLVRAAAPA